MLYPKLAKLLNLNAIDPEVGNFFMRVTKDIMEVRRKNNVQTTDILNLLMHYNKSNSGSLTDEQIAAQTFIMFQANYETSSSTVTFALFELAKNEKMQNKIREEMPKELTYESLNQMEYLDMVINETLRKYPPSPVLLRICSEDYQIPDTDIIIKKGTKTFIPLCGIHYDPEFYEEPEKFKPERFEKNKHIKPGTYFPFGEGPRICIGMRFGLLQIKLIMFLLLKKYKVKPNLATPKTLKFDPNGFTPKCLEAVYLDFEEIK